MGSKKGGELWTRFVRMLKDKSHIFDGFPVKCERHPRRVALLQTPEDLTESVQTGVARSHGDLHVGISASC